MDRNGQMVRHCLLLKLLAAVFESDWPDLDILVSFAGLQKDKEFWVGWEVSATIHYGFTKAALAVRVTYWS